MMRIVISYSLFFITDYFHNRFPLHIKSNVIGTQHYLLTLNIKLRLLPNLRKLKFKKLILLPFYFHDCIVKLFYITLCLYIFVYVYLFYIVLYCFIMAKIFFTHGILTKIGLTKCTRQIENNGGLIMYSISIFGISRGFASFPLVCFNSYITFVVCPTDFKVSWRAGKSFLCFFAFPRLCKQAFRKYTPFPSFSLQESNSSAGQYWREYFKDD